MTVEPQVFGDISTFFTFFDLGLSGRALLPAFGVRSGAFHACYHFNRLCWMSKESLCFFCLYSPRTKEEQKRKKNREWKRARWFFRRRNKKKSFFSKKSCLQMCKSRLQNKLILENREILAGIKIFTFWLVIPSCSCLFVRSCCEWFSTTKGPTKTKKASSKNQRKSWFHTLQPLATAKLSLKARTKITH